MKKMIIPMAIALLSTSALTASDKANKTRKGPRCKEGYVKVSCSDVENAKREFLCWKGDIETKKKEKVCKSKRKRKVKK